jgi:hypothetical protein
LRPCACGGGTTVRGDHRDDARVWLRRSGGSGGSSGSGSGGGGAPARAGPAGAERSGVRRGVRGSGGE